MTWTLVIASTILCIACTDYPKDKLVPGWTTAETCQEASEKFNAENSRWSSWCVETQRPLTLPVPR
jgi:hypothetical protein